MITPDDNVLRAFSVLEHDPQFSHVIRWMRQSLSEQDRENRRLSGEGMNRGQGEALTLERILEVADTARESLKARETRTPGMPQG